jgi:uncharacterized membrane protein
MKRLLLRPFIKGSMVLLPLLVTTWLLWSALAWLNELGVSALHLVHPDLVLFPGVGLLVMLVTLLSVGLLFQFNPISWVYQYVEDAFLRLPLVKTLYGAVKDFAAMFDGEKPKAQQVVLVEMPEIGQLIGFVTSDHVPEQVMRTNEGQNLYAIYLPMSYMVGGYTLFLPKERLTFVDWSVEDAMRFALTAGISQSQARARHEPGKPATPSSTSEVQAPAAPGSAPGSEGTA